MDHQTTLWILALCLGILLWLGRNLQSSQIYYHVHPYLLDNKTGTQIKPKQLIDLEKILKEPANYTNETTALDRLYDRTHQTNLVDGLPMYYGYSDQRDLEISGWPVSNQTSCRQQLEWINQQFKLNPNYKLLKGQRARELTYLIDSYGKLESGALTGMNTWLGSYSQCMKTTLNGGEIKMRYCIAKMRYKTWPEDERGVFLSRMNIGVCLPETCDTSSFVAQRDRIEPLVKLELPAFYQQNLNMEDLYCLPDERSPLRKIPTAGWIFIAFCVIWLTLLIVMTLIDIFSIRRRRETVVVQPNGEKIFETVDRLVPERIELEKVQSESGDRVCHRLSLVRVWREFLSDPCSDSIEETLVKDAKIRLDMRSMNCCKVLMTIALVLGHCMLMDFTQARSLEQRLELNDWVGFRLAFSVGRVLDTFFLFFGALMAYNILKKVPAVRLADPLVWVALNANTLIRVWPLYLFTYVFARSISPYAGDGPWWEYGTFITSTRGQCFHNSWIQAIPYFGVWNKFSLPTCVPPSWFIISYVQLALVIPLITFLIHKLPNHFSRLLLLGYLFLISSLELILKMYKQTTLKPEAFTLYGGFLLPLLEKFESTGTMSTLSRMGSVAFGCYLGYLLRQYELGNIKRWPSWVASKTSLCMACAVQLIVILTPVIGLWLSKHQESTTEQFLAGFLVSMLLWIVATSIQMICCFTIYNRSKFVECMSHRFWHICNKLGFCIYLLHWETMNYNIQHYEQAAPHGFKSQAWELFTMTFCMTIPLSLIIYVFFEAPMTRLLKLFFEPPRQNKARHGREDINGIK